MIGFFRESKADTPAENRKKGSIFRCFEDGSNAAIAGKDIIQRFLGTVMGLIEGK